MRLLADSARHLEQDAVDLGLLFVEQSNQFIILLDGFERLHKHRLAAGTGSMHHSLHAPFLLNLHRDDKAFAADRHQFILHRAALGQTAADTRAAIPEFTRLCFSISRRIRASSGDARSSRVPSG